MSGALGGVEERFELLAVLAAERLRLRSDLGRVFAGLYPPQKRTAFHART